MTQDVHLTIEDGAKVFLEIEDVNDNVFLEIVYGGGGGVAPSWDISSEGGNTLQMLPDGLFSKPPTWNSKEW